MKSSHGPVPGAAGTGIILWRQSATSARRHQPENASQMCMPRCMESLQSTDLRAILDRGKQPLAECRQLCGLGSCLRRNQVKARVRGKGNLERYDEPALGDILLDIGGPAHGNADAVDGGLHRHQDQVEAQSRLFRDVRRQPGSREPEPPVVVITSAGMQERVMGKVFGATQRLVARKQRWAAYRKQ